MIGAWRGTVDRDAKSYGFSVRARPEYEMEVAGVEAVDDATAGRIESGGFIFDRPIAR